MQKAAEKPFTLTIRKNFTSGRPITFSGRRAQAFAREMLENTIILNSHAKDEKRETLRLLSEAVKSGETLVAAAPGEKETAAAKYKQDFQALWESDHILQSKLRGGCPGAALPVKAARQLIIDEHLPILLSTIQSLGSMLHSAVSKNDGKMAEKWLHRLKGGVERIDALSNLLDALTMDSIWEIKALAEHTCTRAALRLAGIEIGADAKKGEMLRASAAYLEELGRKLGTVEGARLVSLLIEIAMASEDKGKLAQGGARYAGELRAGIDRLRASINPERQEVSCLREDDPKRAAFNVFEHHIVNSTVGMITMLSLAEKKPDAVAKFAATGTANALRFLEIATRVRESDDPRVLALVFTSGDTAPYLEKLEGKYSP